MSLKKPNYRDLVNYEQKVENQTSELFGEWLSRFEKAQDVLLLIPYLEQKQISDLESDENAFYVTLIYDYWQAPESFRSCMILMQKGLYQDAMNLSRAILESIVKRKYFFSRKNIVKEFELSSGRSVLIKTMWDTEGGKDSYELYKLFCRYEHKNFGSSTPHMVTHFTKAEKISLLPIFCEQLAGVAINMLNCSMYAYLNLASLFFDHGWLSADPNFLEQYNDAVNYFLRYLHQSKNQFPNSYSFYEIMEQIGSK